MLVREKIFAFVLGLFMTSYVIKIITGASGDDVNISMVLAVLTFAFYLGCILLGSKWMLPSKEIFFVGMAILFLLSIAVLFGRITDSTQVKVVSFAGALTTLLYGKVLTKRELLNIFALTCIAVGGLSAVVQIQGWMTGGVSSLLIGRFVAGGELTVVGFATILGYCFVLSLSRLLLLPPESWKIRVVLIVIGLLLLLGIAATATRGALLFAPLSILAVAYKQVFSKQNKIIVGVIVLGVFLAYAMLEGLASQIEFILERYANIGYEGASVYRLAAYSEALEIFFDNPVFGIGLVNEYPHNMFLEFAVEYGVVGLFVLISILTMTLSAIKHSQRYPDAYVVKTNSALFVFVFLVSMVSMSYSFNRWLWLSVSALLALSETVAYTRSAGRTFSRGS